MIKLTHSVVLLISVIVLTPGMINDNAGSIEFTAPNDATNEHKFANINVTAASVTDSILKQVKWNLV